MATFSFGNVPSPIAQAVRLAQLREIQNPNLALQRQLEQAAQLQQLQQQSPEGQLALQLKQAQLNAQLQAQPLQNAINEQKLRDLQNPQDALVRQLTEELTLKGALNPDLGIRAATPGFSGQTIGSPSAIGQTESELDAAIAANPQLEIPASAAGSPETPISIFGVQTGLTSNPNIPREALETKTNAQIKLANARATAQGQPIEYFINPDGTTGWRPKKVFGGSAPVADTLKTSTGEDAKEKPKPVGVKSILATNDETGRVTNISLASGEAVPEGFTPVTKKSSEDYKNIDAFRKEISKNPVIKQFGDVQKSKQRIDVAMSEALETNNFVVVDQALISSFNRLLEPDSVTMVSEYNRTSADAPLINRLTAGLTRPISGGRLAPADREALLRLSNGIYQSSLGNYSRTVDYFEGIGERRGWNASDFIQPLIESGGVAAPAPTTATAPSGRGTSGTAPSGMTFKKLN